MVSTKKVLLTVLSMDKVEHNVKYVVTKQGGNITLDCTDFEEEEVSWTRLGGGYDMFKVLLPSLFSFFVQIFHDS